MGQGPQNRGGYRAPAPNPRDFIDWPDDFGTRFIVCVDTEEEFDWRKPFDREARSTRHMAAMPAAHARFAAAGVPLTFLIDHPIATSPEAVDVLRALIADGRSAIGTQLHPWVNPPFEEEMIRFNSFTGNLAPALERAKLTVLTETIAQAFGERPIVYRAGRYGVGPQTMQTLAELGYRADTSMRAGYDYSSEGGPDFTAIGNRAFRIGDIVELPFTTVFAGVLRGKGPALHAGLGRIPHGRGIAARLGLFNRVSLTPEDMPLREALEAVRVAVGEGLRLLNFAFHSPSIVPGNTPFVRDAADLAAFERWWDAMFAELDRLGVRPAAMAEVLDACGPPPASARPAPAGGL